MSTALYRRYRPDSFDTLIGQDHVTVPLRAALKAGKVTHAYLFSGPRGCGKTTSARIFARCLNCAQGPTDMPCGTCDSCVELATGGPGSLDVVEIDAASHGGVDDARELRERATFAPVRDRYKIFIIDEAHMVSSQGFNALLKLVEEPPEHVKFVFATTEPDKVLGTIRSRTHHYPFRLVPPDVLEPYLAHLANEERIDIAPGVLNLVIRAGGGSVRDTLSVLDQLMAGAVDASLPYAQAVALLGYTDVALLDESVDALAGGDGAAVYRVVERMVDAGHDPRRFVEDLLQRLRDLLIIAVAGEGAGDVLTNIPTDQMERMVAQARNWGPRALSRAADLTDQSLRAMVGATSPRLQLELLIGRILIPEPQAEPALSGVVGMAGGGAPHELSAAAASSAGGASRPFGAEEAREQLRRQRAAAKPAEQPGASVQQPVAQESASVPVSPGDWDAPAIPGSSQPTPQSASGSAPQPVAHSQETPQPAQQAPQERPRLSAVPQRETPQDRPALSEPGQQQAAAPQGAQQGISGVSSSDADMLRQRWAEVIERLSSISRVAWAMLKENAQLGGVEGSTAVVLLPVQAMVDNFMRGNRGPDVERAIYEATGLQLRVLAQVGQARGGAAVTTPSAAAAQPAHGQPAPAQAVPAQPLAPQPVVEQVQVVQPPAWNETSLESPAHQRSAPTEPLAPAQPVAAVPASDPDIPMVRPEPQTQPEPTAPAPEPVASAPAAVSVFADAWPDVAPVPNQPTTSDKPSASVAPTAPEEPATVTDMWATPSANQVDPFAAPQWDSMPAPVETSMPNAIEPHVEPEQAQTSTHVEEAVPEAPHIAAADDDTASIDDEDLETPTVGGIEAVQSILGGKVIDEKTDESAW